MLPPRISVLLPARDAQATVREAVEDLLAQEGAPPLELVCVDDASSDGTREVLEDCAARDRRVRIVAGEGQGLVAALNLGLAHCRGELIARMDADDRTAPERLALQAAALDADGSLAAVGCRVRCTPRPLTPGLSRLEELLNLALSKQACRLTRFIESPLVHPSCLFRASALRELGGYRDAGWAEDWDLLLRLLEAGHEVEKLPQVLLEWRDSPQRLTRTGSVYSADAMQRLRAHFLARGPLRGRPFDLWGAGPTGKWLARELEQLGLRPRRFIDIDRHKRVARGRPVVLPAALGPPDGALIVCAVGAAGARETIRAELLPRGHLEGCDFLFAA